jgi:hypothetical protein
VVAASGQARLEVDTAFTHVTGGFTTSDRREGFRVPPRRLDSGRPFIDNAAARESGGGVIRAEGAIVSA